MLMICKGFDKLEPTMSHCLCSVHNLMLNVSKRNNNNNYVVEKKKNSVYHILKHLGFTDIRPWQEIPWRAQIEVSRDYYYYSTL